VNTNIVVQIEQVAHHSGLEFVSTLIWQVIVAICLWQFRGELKALLKRILSVKHGDTEVLFQKPSDEALEANPVVEEALRIRDEEGFFTKQGIEKLVSDSKSLKGGRPKDSILVFSTNEQHTWLVATESHIYFVLDDEGTRSSQRLIQKIIPLEEALPVHAEKESDEAGSFRLGKSGDWYYSYHLLGKPSKATQRLTAFVNSAKGV
jgi:hypothetical protein